MAPWVFDFAPHLEAIDQLTIMASWGFDFAPHLRPYHPFGFLPPAKLSKIASQIYHIIK